ncbi:MAG: hypothetical protein PWP31_1256 [Clostridia bacterium]|nr:hypothetical protein [Clostridia bacterium]
MMNKVTEVMVVFQNIGEKRGQILKAAAKIFAEEGYYKAKIADIANAAGMGKGTIYEYFSSKKELFQQLLVQIFNSYLDMLGKIVKEEPTLGDFIERLCSESFEYFQNQREIASIFLHDHPSIDASTKQLFISLHNERLQCVIDYLEKAKQKGEMRDDISPWLASALLTGFIETIGHIFFYRGGEVNLGETVKQAKDIILNGLSN